MTALGAKFTAGELSGTDLTLTREDGTTGTCDVLLMRGTLTDNEDSTFDLELGSE